MHHLPELLYATAMCLGCVAALASAIPFHRAHPESAANQPRGFHPRKACANFVRDMRTFNHH